MPTNWKREESKGCPAAASALRSRPPLPDSPDCCDTRGTRAAASLRDLTAAPRSALGGGQWPTGRFPSVSTPASSHCHAGSTREGSNQGHQHRDCPAGVFLGEVRSTAGERGGWYGTGPKGF